MQESEQQLAHCKMIISSLRLCREALNIEQASREQDGQQTGSVARMILYPQTLQKTQVSCVIPASPAWMSKVPKASLLATDTCLPPVMEAQVPSRHGTPSLETSEWRGLGPTGGFCVLPYTHPGASRLTSPVTVILTSELEFSFKRLILPTDVGTHSWEASSNSGLMSQNLVVYSCTNTGKNTQLLDTLAEDQRDDNLQDNDISVTAVNCKPNFKRRLNTVK